MFTLSEKKGGVVKCCYIFTLFEINGGFFSLSSKVLLCIYIQIIFYSIVLFINANSLFLNQSLCYDHSLE